MESNDVHFEICILLVEFSLQEGEKKMKEAQDEAERKEQEQKKPEENDDEEEDEEEEAEKSEEPSEEVSWLFRIFFVVK